MRPSQGKTFASLKMRTCKKYHILLCAPYHGAGTLTHSTSGVHVNYMIWLAFTSGHSFPFWGLSESHVSWNFHLLFSASIRIFSLWGYLSANGDFLFPLWLPCVLTGFLYEESHVLISTSYSLRKGPHLASKEHSRKVTVFLPQCCHMWGKAKGSAACCQWMAHDKRYLVLHALILHSRLRLWYELT